MSEAILEILNVFKLYNENEEKAKRSGDPQRWVKLRCGYDPDAKYYHDVERLKPWDAVRGDVITSFWTPYITLLKREVGAGFSVDKKDNDELDLLILQIISPGTTPQSEKIKAVNKRVERFAELYYTRGNFMLLPKRPKGMRESLNLERMRVTQDRIDWTLYECFRSGELSPFFNRSDRALEQWIGDQNLTSVFVNKTVGRENIDWFIPGTTPKKITRMSTQEIYAYLDRAVRLIEQRNQ